MLHFRSICVHLHHVTSCQFTPGVKDCSLRNQQFLCIQLNHSYSLPEVLVSWACFALFCFFFYYYYLKNTCLKFQQLPAEDFFLFLWVLPSLPLPPQALLPSGPLFLGDGFLLGASLFSYSRIRETIFAQVANFLETFLGLGFSVSADRASSRLLAASTSFSAIRLHEQKLNLKYCKRRETDFYWLSSSSSRNNMSSINCHSVEKRKASNYPLKSKYVSTAFTQNRTQVPEIPELRVCNLTAACVCYSSQ